MRPIPLISLALVAACGPFVPGIPLQSCDIQEREVAFDEGTSFGTPEGVLASVGTDFSAPLTWSDGTTTILAFTFAPDTMATFLDAKASPDSNLDCPDQLEFPGTASVTTDDGRLAEEVEATLLYGTDSPALVAVFDPLRGMLDAADFGVATDGGDWKAWVEIAFDPAGSVGEVYVHELCDSCYDAILIGEFAE